MAKSASKASGAGSRKAADKTSKKASPKAAPRKVVARSGEDRPSGSDRRDEDGDGAADMFVKLLQSPIVADWVAVAATAALAALAEHGFNRSGGDGRRAGKAVKAAGKAAAAAIGRRVANEVEEIRKAAKPKSEGA